MTENYKRIKVNKSLSGYKTDKDRLLDHNRFCKDFLYPAILLKGIYLNRSITFHKYRKYSRTSVLKGVNSKFNFYRELNTIKENISKDFLKRRKNKRKLEGNDIIEIPYEVKNFWDTIFNVLGEEILYVNLYEYFNNDNDLGNLYDIKMEQSFNMLKKFKNYIEDNLNLDKNQYKEYSDFFNKNTNFEFDKRITLMHFYKIFNDMYSFFVKNFILNYSPNKYHQDDIYIENYFKIDTDENFNVVFYLYFGGCESDTSARWDLTVETGEKDIINAFEVFIKKLIKYTTKKEGSFIDDIEKVLKNGDKIILSSFHSSTTITDDKSNWGKGEIKNAKNNFNEFYNFINYSYLLGNNKTIIGNTKIKITKYESSFKLEKE